MDVVVPGGLATDIAPEGVAVMERWLPGGDRMLFFTNTGLSGVKARAITGGGSVSVVLRAC